MKKKLIIGQFRLCDILTMTGTLFAIIGSFLAISGYFKLSICCLIICAICDSFDGYISRKHKWNKFEQTYGSELDSLSDIISFGIFPSILAITSVKAIPMYIVALIFSICGLIRLTYFNTLAINKKSIKGYFVGVPITTIAFIYPIIFIFYIFNIEIYKILTPILFLLLALLFITNIKVKKPDISLIIYKIKNIKIPKCLNIFLNLFIFPLILILLCDLFYKTNGFSGFALFDIFSTINNNFKVFIYIYLIMFSLNLLFISIFNSRISKFILIILFGILLVVDDFKVAIMQNPVMFSDIFYLNPSNANMAFSFVDSVKGIWVIKSIVKFVLFIVWSIICFKNKKQIIKFKNIFFRILLSIICVSYILLVFNNSYSYSKNVIENIYNSSYSNLLKIGDYKNVYYSKGFFGGMFYNYYGSNINIPDGYSKKDTEKLLDNVEENKKSWGKPNVVFILSESFSDMIDIEDIKFDKELLPNINSYKDDKDKMVIKTLSSTYGGASIISEFEMLTAASNEFFPSGYIAYTQYYLDDKSAKAPNIIKEFNKNGYSTKYITPWSSESYRSSQVYNILGVSDKEYFITGDIKGLYLSDESITNIIINELKEKTDQRQFLMVATSQNHGPYQPNRYTKYDIDIESTKLNKEDSEILKTYAQGTYDADKELNNLYKEIQKINEPTIIVFFGDHLPFLPNSNGENIYDKLSYFNTNNENLNYLRKYTTTSVILSNYDIDLDKNIEYINLNYLSAYVMSKLDIDIDPYYNFVNNVRKIVPVFTRNFIYDDGNFKSYDDINIDIYKNLTEYKNLQYYEFYDK